jgi:hypothetical protein
VILKVLASNSPTIGMSFEVKFQAGNQIKAR